MSKREKLINRFISEPKDFTWDELEKMLFMLGFELVKAGKTGGSRVRFFQVDYPPITLHKPHPGKILKPHQVKEIKNYLKAEGLL